MVRPEAIVERGYKAYAFSRSLLFGLEFRLLHSVARLLPSQGEVPLPYVDKAIRPFLIDDINQLYAHDARLFQDGIAPWHLLLPEWPLAHSKRLMKIVMSGIGMSKLRRERKTRVDGAPEDLPEYYRRHFHWQQGGYLTEASGQLYDHQVEILFKGTAAAMRRLALRPLHDYLSKQSGSQRILEVGAGTGLLGHEVTVSFPQHSLTLTDLSAAYLQLARERLRAFPRVSFREAAVEKLPFADASFDVVYSAFMFHELPRAVRESALAEFQRVLRPGGMVLLLDSIQENDVPEYQAALDKFPEDYHEPFYRDYSQWSLSEAFARHGLDVQQEARGFFTKWLSAMKATTP